MHTLQNGPRSVSNLLTAREVQDVLHIDRSTVYRMADDGRLPAIRVGKQWRFPREQILALVSEFPGSDAPGRTHRTPGDGPIQLDPTVSAAAIDVPAELLGVMMVVTDMEGRPVTPIANPCPWFIEHSSDPAVMSVCTAEWRDLAENHSFEPEFRVGHHGFECARVFIRSGRELVGMVLAGGVRPPGSDADDLFELTAEQRTQVLHALPKIATAISRQASVRADAPMEETQ